MIYKNVEDITIKYQNMYNRFQIDPSLTECVDENQMFSSPTELTMNYFWKFQINEESYNEVFSTTICLNGSESKSYFEAKVLEFAPEINNYIAISFSKSYINNGWHYFEWKPSLTMDVGGTEKTTIIGERRNDISFECYNLYDLSRPEKMGMVDCSRGIFIIDLDFLNEGATHEATQAYTKTILWQGTSVKLNYINFISKEIRPYYNISCSIDTDEYLYSTNKTFINGENGDIINSKIDGSKDDVRTYATGIYFKDYDNNLLATAKFQPIEIGKQKLVFNVRIFLR